MQLKYRGVAYQASPISAMPTQQSGIYRGIPFRRLVGQKQPQGLGVELTYRGISYTR
ncbi:MAG: DUF4278 domain-containing protein [Leptolyngbya sp. SIO1D8]|nr:DUF4278 domain-containing protein [Leptolyngbya sp. SIO1D8]